MNFAPEDIKTAAKIYDAVNELIYNWVKIKFATERYPNGNQSIDFEITTFDDEKVDFTTTWYDGGTENNYEMTYKELETQSKPEIKLESQVIMFYTSETEYEPGWGPRPDGLVIGVSRSVLENYINDKSSTARVFSEIKPFVPDELTIQQMQDERCEIKCVCKNSIKQFGKEL